MLGPLLTIVPPQLLDSAVSTVGKAIVAAAISAAYIILSYSGRLRR
jgi:hypothetical protein